MTQRDTRIARLRPVASRSGPAKQHSLAIRKANRSGGQGRGTPGALAAVVVAAFAAFYLAPLMAHQPATTSVFTKAQVDAGRVTYKNACASCHTPDLGGSPEYPQLAGEEFIGAWKTRTSRDLLEFIHATMPPEGPMLTDEQALGVVAFILYENGATAGNTALTATTAAPIGSIATGKRPGR